MNLDTEIKMPHFQEIPLKGRVGEDVYKKVPALRLNSGVRKQDVKAVHIATPGFGLRKEAMYPYLYSLNKTIVSERDPVHVFAVDMPVAEGFETDKPINEWDHNDYLNSMVLMSRKILKSYGPTVRKINMGYSLSGTMSLMSNMFDERITYGAPINLPNRRRMDLILDIADIFSSEISTNLMVYTSGMEWPTLSYCTNEKVKDENLRDYPDPRAYPIPLLRDILDVYDTVDGRIEDNNGPITWLYAEGDNVVKDSIDDAKELEKKYSNGGGFFTTHKMKGGNHSTPIVNYSLNSKYDFQREPLHELVGLAYSKGRKHY